MRPMRQAILAALLLALAAPAAAEDRSIGITPDQIEWAQVKNLGEAVVLLGDPRRRGPYVVRLNVPPNTATSAHSHPQDESVTVISGWIGFGLGPVVDRAKGRVLPAGSFLHLPARTLHFAWTGPEGAVIQAHGNGPFP